LYIKFIVDFAIDTDILFGLDFFKLEYEASYYTYVYTMSILLQRRSDETINISNKENEFDTRFMGFN